MKISKVLLLTMWWFFATAWFWLLFVSAADKQLKMDLDNAIQHINKIKFIPTWGGSQESTIQKMGTNRLIKVETKNFVLSKSENDNKISTNTSTSTILWWSQNDINWWSYNTVMGWYDNDINGGKSYSTILWWNGNKLNWSNSVILWWKDNRLAWDYSLVVWWSDNDVNGNYSAVAWSSNNVTANNSVSLWLNSNVQSANSFLWTDGNHASEVLSGGRLFAVVSDNWMVINTNKAHSFSKLTVGWPVIIWEAGNIACWSWQWWWIVKLVKWDGTNREGGAYCFCSCDWYDWNSMYDRWTCEYICRNTPKRQVECDGAVYKICNGVQYSYSWTCNKWNVVEWTWAYLVDSNNIIHWACQTDDGQVAQCSGSAIVIWSCNEPSFCRWTLPANTIINNPTAEFPVGGDKSYDYSATSQEVCKFHCKDNYTWNSSSRVCVPATTWASCLDAWLPNTTAYEYVKNTYSQTWNGNFWYPVAKEAVYDPSGVAECSYKCKINYSWVNGRCVPNNVQTACTWLIANSTWVNSIFSQTWNGSAWKPASVGATYNTSIGVQCSYKCDSNHVWNGSNCNCPATAWFGESCCGYTVCRPTSDPAAPNTFCANVGDYRNNNMCVECTNFGWECPRSDGRWICVKLANGAGECQKFTGLCWTSNGQTFATTPTSNLCLSPAVASSVTAWTDKYTWACTIWSAVQECSAKRKVNGLCLNTTLDKCVAWTYNDVADSDTQYKWQCLWINGWSNADCSKDKWPQCKPTHYGCTIWDKINWNYDSVARKYTWRCKNGSEISDQCVELVAENWVCGTYNMQCRPWTPIDVADSDTQYKWQCKWINNWTIADCTEDKQPRCSDENYYSCALWTATDKHYDTATKKWRWKCVNGSKTVTCDMQLACNIPTATYGEACCWVIHGDPMNTTCRKSDGTQGDYQCLSHRVCEECDNYGWRCSVGDARSNWNWLCVKHENNWKPFGECVECYAPYETYDLESGRCGYVECGETENDCVYNEIKGDLSITSHFAGTSLWNGKWTCSKWDPNKNWQSRKVCGPVVYPSCWTSAGREFASAPTSNLCSEWTPSSVTTNETTYTWTCKKWSLSTDCSANIPQWCRIATAKRWEACCSTDHGDPINTDCTAAGSIYKCLSNNICEQCDNYGWSCYNPQEWFQNYWICVKRDPHPNANWTNFGECVWCRAGIYETYDTDDGTCAKVQCGRSYGDCLYLKYKNNYAGNDMHAARRYGIYSEWFNYVEEFDGDINGDGTWTCTQWDPDRNWQSSVTCWTVWTPDPDPDPEPYIPTCNISSAWFGEACCETTTCTYEGTSCMWWNCCECTGTWPCSKHKNGKCNGCECIAQPW